DAARNALSLRLHGERGALFNDNGHLTFNQRPREQYGSSPLGEFPPEPTGEEPDLLRDLHAWITLGREPGISARHNLETMAACEMMVRSTTQGRTVRREELEADDKVIG